MGAYVISRTSEYPVAAGVNISSRDAIHISPTGYAQPAPAPTAGLVGVVVGSAAEDVDNTGGADGAKFIVVEHSCGDRAFLLATALTIADVGKQVYIGANPKTVTTTSTNAVLAGRLQGIEADGRARVILPL